MRWSVLFCLLLGLQYGVCAASEETPSCDRALAQSTPGKLVVFQVMYWNTVEILTVNSDRTVTGNLKFFGYCKGNYSISVSPELALVIEFDGLDGPGSSGGCANAKMKIMGLPANIFSIPVGEALQVTVGSQIYFDRPLWGRLVRIQ